MTGSEQVASSTQVEALLLEVRALIAAFRQHTSRDVRPRDENRARVVVSYVTQAYWSAETYLSLVDGDHIEDTLTIARRVMEHALTAAWLGSNARAMEALEVESNRVERNLAESARSAAQQLPDFDVSGLVERLERAESRSRTPESEQLRRLEQICTNYFDAPILYYFYRALSGFAHPSPRATDPLFGRGRRWVKERELWRELSALVVASSLLWASRAEDELTHGKPQKKRLKAVARRIGCTPVLVPVGNA